MPGTLEIVEDIEVVSGLMIKVSDLTQPYNAVSNTGGWYPVSLGPNPSVFDIQTAYYIHTLPDGSLVVIDVLAATIPLYDVTAGTINNPFVVTNLMLGYADGVKISDGLHKGNLEVAGQFGPNDPPYDFVSSPTVWFYMTKGVECCVAAMHRRIKTDNLSCDDALFKLAQKADGVLDTLLFNITCGDWTKADEMLVELQAICEETGCNCC